MVKNLVLCLFLLLSFVVTIVADGDESMKQASQYYNYHLFIFLFLMSAMAENIMANQIAGFWTNIISQINLWIILIFSC